MIIDVNETGLPVVIEIVLGLPGPQGPAGAPGAAGQGVPAGGAVGQVLTKSSNADFSTSWQGMIDPTKLPIAGGTMTGKLVAKPSSAAGGAGINLGSGANPTTGVQGDVWTAGVSLSWWDFFAGTPVSAVSREQAQSITGQKTFTVQARFAAGTALEASIRIAPTGTAPTTPVDGDVWIGNAAGAGNFNWQASGVTRQAMDLSTNQFVTGIKFFLTQTWFSTPSASQASIRLPHGVAPTAPGNGDVWTTTAGLFIRINNATVGPLVDAASVPDEVVGGKITIGVAPPASPSVGDVWIDTN